MPTRYITRPALRDVLDRHEQTILLWSRSEDWPKSHGRTGQRGRTHLHDASEVYTWLLRHKKATPAEIEQLTAWEVSQ